jgi:uncharacterized repeat protein (TIGR01451 family)
MKSISKNCVPDRNGTCSNPGKSGPADEPPCNGRAFRKFGLWATAIIIAVFTMTGIAEAQIQLSISKSHNAPNPIQSGAPFTYTITYNWSGGAPGTLYIIDQVPTTLDVLSALPGSPISLISGNNVVFTLTGLTLPSGSGTVQINARFKPGVTCGGTRACNTAEISLTNAPGTGVKSNEVCVTAATPTNKWQFEKEWIAGCAVDDEVIFRIKVVNPAGSDIGGVNLTNVTLDDLVPPGSTILSVTGWPWTGISGTTLTPTPQTFGVSPWTMWYVAYVKVKFPTPTFSVGQTVVNTASLRFNTPCDQNYVTWTDTAKVTLCAGVKQGALGKYFSLNLYFPNNPSYYPTFAPGCCGLYTVSFTNTGTLGLNSFVMEDNFPSKLDLNKITTNVPAGNTPVTVDVYCWSGSSCSVTPCTTVVYNTAGWQTMTGLPANVCKVKWTYSGTIAVTQNVTNYLDVCVRAIDYATGNPVMPGDNITNSVTVTAAGLAPITATHSKLVDASSPKVIATKMFIGGCSNTCNVNPWGPFQPGDIVRFRMAVANIGNISTTMCTINDILPSGLTYVGNETYFFGSFNWMANIYSPPCCSTTVAVPSQVGGTITTPTVGATNLTWTFPYLPARCDGTVDYFIIEFDVKISDTPPAPPGQYQNTFKISASNVPAVTSNVAYLTVNQTAQLQAIKEVRKTGVGAPWAFSTTALPGGAIQYRLRVTNTGNTPLTNLCLLDIMPWLGDIKVLPAYLSRGSMFNIPYAPANGAISITPAGFTTYYNSIGLVQSQNPKRSTECGGFCGVADPVGAVTGTFGTGAVQTYSFKVSANSSVNLAPGASLDVIVPAKVPASGVKVQDNACNSFALQAVPLGMPSVCLSAESNNACVSVEEPKPCMELAEARLKCVGQNSLGEWVYQLSFTITNATGQPATLQMTSNLGTVSNINPGSIPNNTPTNVTATFVTTSQSGQVCFVAMLNGPNHQILCEKVFCIDLQPCPQPCPCPFEIKIDTKPPTQASGNLVMVNNLISISTPVLRVRATIVSASVTQTCVNPTLNTTYTPGASIIWTSLNPMLTSGLNTSEVTYTNLQCPQVNNQPFNMYLSIPNAPPKKCVQKVKICIRYTITDCKCNTCDTLVCYEFDRKWSPFDIFDNGGGIFFPGTIEPKGKGSNLQESADKAFATINLTSSTKGTLTITNPAEDEYSIGIFINSLKVSTTPGVTITTLKPNNAYMSNGTKDQSGLTSNGNLKPGQFVIYELGFDNADAMKSWVNTLDFKYTIADIPDTMTASVNIKVRAPGLVGGDILTNTKGDAIKNARTFAIWFQNANIAKDSVSKLILRVKDGTILAVGPGLSNKEVHLHSHILNSDGSLVLLTSDPTGPEVTEAGIPANNTIGPIYITVAGDNPESIILDFETQTSEGYAVTQGSIELTSPLTGIIDEGTPGLATVMLSEAVPNPTDGSTLIRFTLPEAEKWVTLAVTDIRGTKVATLINGTAMETGIHEVTFNPGTLPNGVYYFTLSTGSTTQTRKIIVLR